MLLGGVKRKYFLSKISLLLFSKLKLSIFAITSLNYVAIDNFRMG